MEAEIQLMPLDERGIKLLDQLEGKTGLLPLKTDAQGGRAYALHTGDPGEVDRMLDRVGADWRAHLPRTS